MTEQLGNLIYDAARKLTWEQTVYFLREKHLSQLNPDLRERCGAIITLIENDLKEHLEKEMTDE